MSFNYMEKYPLPIKIWIVDSAEWLLSFLSDISERNQKGNQKLELGIRKEILVAVTDFECKNEHRMQYSAIRQAFM